MILLCTGLPQTCMLSLARHIKLCKDETNDEHVVVLVPEKKAWVNPVALAT